MGVPYDRTAVSCSLVLVQTKHNILILGIQTCRMKVHEGSETVIVVGSEKNFEFRIVEDQLECVSSNVPSEVLDIVEEETSYDIERSDQPTEFKNLRFRAPYEGSEAASVLNFNSDDERFDSLINLMGYGIRVSVRVHPDGKTELYEVNGEVLSDPVVL